LVHNYCKLNHQRAKSQNHHPSAHPAKTCKNDQKRSWDSSQAPCHHNVIKFAKFGYWKNWSLFARPKHVDPKCWQCIASGAFWVPLPPALTRPQRTSTWCNSIYTLKVPEPFLQQVQQHINPNVVKALLTLRYIESII
jgi:hypothetical protein